MRSNLMWNLIREGYSLVCVYIWANEWQTQLYLFFIFWEPVTKWKQFINGIDAYKLMSYTTFSDSKILKKRHYTCTYFHLLFYFWFKIILPLSFQYIPIFLQINDKHWVKSFSSYHLFIFSIKYNIKERVWHGWQRYKSSKMTYTCSV